MKEGVDLLPLAIAAFIIGCFAGCIVEWFAFKIPKENDANTEDFTTWIKDADVKNIIVPVVTGIIYGLLFHKYGLDIRFFKYALIFPVMFLIAIIDYKTHYVYFKTIVCAMSINILFILIDILSGGIMPVKTYLLGGIVPLMIFSVLALVNMMGWGDVEVFSVCGLTVGFIGVWEVVAISFLICTVYGIASAVKNRNINSKVAFGPAIFLAFLIFLLKK